MRLYLGLARLFPHSFTAKVFFVAFVGTHVPLIVLVAYVLSTGGGIASHGDVLGLVLLATLVGTVATLLALKAILRPLFAVGRAMRRFEDEGQIDQLPLDMRDELGQLMLRTDRMMHRLQDRIATTQMTADTDPLTGLLNRRGFDRQTRLGAAGAVLHFDLDHFKAINDRFGHDVGDRVLCDVARVIAANLRSGDILARFGGEEFVAFLPAATSAEADKVAERARRAIERDVLIDGVPVTASVGTSIGDQALADRIAQADQATYRSKRAGRNRVTAFAAE